MTNAPKFMVYHHAVKKIEPVTTLSKIAGDHFVNMLLSQNTEFHWSEVF